MDNLFPVCLGALGGLILTNIVRRGEAKEKKEAEEQARMSKEKAKEADQARAEAEKKTKEANDRAAQAEANAQTALAEKKKLDEDLRRTREAWEKGINPVRWPTPEELLAAKEAIKYNPECLHFAVCGSSGCGKSSLINSLRGINGGKKAAPVGVTETTGRVTRYPDPRKEEPFRRFVWCDIPGAGTLNVPDWEYFLDQGLFVFDFIVLVYDNRFTKVDAGILENCRRFNIPCFAVRSKADQHIENMVKQSFCHRRTGICTPNSETTTGGYDNEASDSDLDDDGDDFCIEDEEAEDEKKHRLRKEYIEGTRANFQANMRKVVATHEGWDPELEKTPVYIVSSYTLHRVVLSLKNKMTVVDPRGDIIDERRLYERILQDAKERKHEDCFARKPGNASVGKETGGNHGPPPHTPESTA